MLLYVKDRHNVSGDAYHEMAQMCKAMPRHYKLKQRIAKLNMYMTPLVLFGSVGVLTFVR